ncbi:MAG: hypothetical protein RR865_14045, partial [Clostridia bacterium]
VAWRMGDGMGWDGMGWDGMGWDGMGWVEREMGGHHVWCPYNGMEMLAQDGMEMLVQNGMEMLAQTEINIGAE